MLATGADILQECSATVENPSTMLFCLWESSVTIGKLKIHGEHPGEKKDLSDWPMVTLAVFALLNQFIQNDHRIKHLL